MSAVATAPKPSTTRTVTTNSIWYGLDSVMAILMVFLSSIPMARALGPERLGYFNYIQWLCAISGTLGNMGIPAATSKFMALYLGRGEGHLARAVFRYALRTQALLAGTITLGGMAVVIGFADPHYRAVSLIQIAAILPAMLTQIPTFANLASENMRRNIPGGLIADVVFLFCVWASLAFHWDLAGVAVGMLLSKTTELVLRYRAAHGWLREHRVGELSSEAKKPMFRFAGQQLYMGLIGALLWNKSDVVLLKWLSADLRQVTFFTLAYNIIEKIVMIPQIIGASMSISMVAKAGDEPSRAAKMTAIATRYMLLLSAPLLFGAYLVAGPAVRVLYGPRYAATAPILATAALLAIVKPLLGPADGLFRATGRQGYMLVCATVCTALNMGLDAALIPRYGAMGAAIGNGVGQGVLVLGYLVIAVVWFDVKLDYRAFLLILISAAAMFPAAFFFNHFLAAPLALAADVLAGPVIFLLMLRLTGVLQAADLQRIQDVTGMLPARVQPLAGSTVRLVLGSAAQA